MTHLTFSDLKRRCLRACAVSLSEYVAAAGVRAVGALLAAGCLLLSHGPALAQSKYAMVIANADYELGSDIAAAARDSGLVADSLRAQGYFVTRRSNQTHDDLALSLKQFVNTARLNDISVLYYTGHVMTLNDETLLLPVDAAPRTAEDARLQGLPVGRLVQQLDRNNSAAVLLFETGRQNAVVRYLDRNLRRGDVAKLRSGASVVQAPDRGMIAFAAAADRLKPETDQGEVSPFSDAVASVLLRKRGTLKDLADQLAVAVSKATRERQNPQIRLSDTAGLYVTARPLAVPVIPDADTREAEEFADLLESNIPEEYQAFLQKYPDSRFAGPVLARIVELRGLDEETRQESVIRTHRIRALQQQLKQAKARYQLAKDAALAGGFPLELILDKRVATGDVTMRGGPSSSAKWLGTVKKGTVLEAHGLLPGGRWMQVRSDDNGYGYVSAKFFVPLAGTERGVWESLQAETGPEQLQAFITRFPGGIYHATAIERLIAYNRGLDQRNDGIENAGYLGGGPLQGITLGDETPQLQPDAETVNPLDNGPVVHRPVIERIPEMGQTVEVLDEQYVAVQRAKLRRLPWVRTRTITTAEPGTRLNVTGRVREVPWLRVRHGGGRDVYVHADLIAPYAGSVFDVWAQVSENPSRLDLQDFVEQFGGHPLARQALEMLKDFETSAAIEEVVPPSGSGTPVSPTAAAKLKTYSDRTLNVLPVEVRRKANDDVSRQLSAIFGRRLQTRVLADRAYTEPGVVLISAQVLEDDFYRIPAPEVRGDEEPDSDEFRLLADVIVSWVDTRTGEIIDGRGEVDLSLSAVEIERIEGPVAVMKATEIAANQILDRLLQ